MIVRALIALALASAAHAGVVYRYTTDVSGNPLLRHASGRVWVDGERSRTELDPEPEPRAADVILVSDGKTRFLNLGNQTWYSRKPSADPSAAWKIAPVGKPKVTQVVEGKETIDGRAATKHVIRAEWRATQDFQGTKVKLTFGLTILLWATGELPRVPKDPRLGSYEPDPEEVTKAFTAIEGTPLRLVVVSSRAYEGSRPTVITSTTTYHDFQTVDVPASKFEVPKNFREQEPVIGFAKPEHW